MTHPTSTDQAQDGDGVENFVIDDAAAPQLAAIQQGYEEARASIIDPARAPLNWIHDPADPHPDTEAIDVDALPPPPHDATPPTEAMSVAAKHLAGQQALGEPASPAPATTRTADLLGLRRWWRAFWTP